MDSREANVSGGRRYVVYGLVDPRDGSIRYVGRTQDLKGRLGAHRSEGGRWWPGEFNQRKHAWLRELRDAGLTFGSCVLEVAEDFGALCDAEEKWISKALALGWPLTNGHGKSSGKGPGGIANRFAIAEFIASSSASPTPENAGVAL